MLGNETKYQSLHMREKNFPYVEVLEQPSPHDLRFRYQCEGRTAGYITGEHSTHENKTYPTIKVHNYQGSAVIIISCVTKDNPPKPHPHNLVGKDVCRNGIYSVKVNLQDGIMTFNNIGIQCVKRNQVKDALEQRKHENIDPFRTGFDHIKYPDKIDLNIIRLCFQVFILGPEKNFNIPLKPIVSGLIHNKKAVEELVICKLSHFSAPVSGGMEMMLFCEKVTKEDIQVKFYEIKNNTLFWEGYGDFKPINVHKKVGISFKTPKYCNQDIREPVIVNIQLRKMSDGSTSLPLPFQMIPLEIFEPNGLKRKRQKYDNDPRSYLLSQLQAQAEKKQSQFNEALLFHQNVSNYDGYPINYNQPLLQPINNNHILTEKMNYNIPFNENDYLAQKGPALEPQIVSGAGTSNDCHQNRQQNLSRRRMENPPPNVTINSYSYREPDNLQQRQSRCSRFSAQQPVFDVPFDLNDIPYLDQLNHQDLAIIKTNSDNITDNLSESLSKGLSISDQIQETLQDIQELNGDIQSIQQQNVGNFWMNERVENCGFVRGVDDSQVIRAPGGTSLFVGE